MKSNPSARQAQPTAPPTQQVIMVAPVPSAAPVNAGMGTLVVTWICLLLPIPGVSIVLASLFSFITLIISIICMAKNNVSAGVMLLLGNLIGGLIFYFLGLGVMILLGAQLA